MKIFKFLTVALVAMLGFTACDKDCDHNFIEYDYSEVLVGTWTCLEDGGLAEAMVIKADGSFTTTGVMKGGSLYEEKGTIKVVNNKVSLVFEGDTDVIEGRLEFVAGKSLSIVINEEYDIRLTYDYCENDLSDEIVGLWVATDGPYMSVEKFTEDGKSLYTGYVPESEEMVVNSELTYKVIGDLQFHLVAVDGEEPIYVAHRLVYFPNYTTKLGDTMTWQTKEGISFSRLRIKEELDLPGHKYDYRATYVTNVKGEDKDIPFLNTSFNFAKMDGSIIDKFLKSILFTVEFPNANTIKYSYLLEGQNIVIEAPIEVEGNKMTIKMSANNPAYQDVDMYAFQDQDNTQMHWYMPTTSFEKFFGNTSVALMLGYGQLDKDDTEGIANVYKTIADAVESINLSLVMTKAK